MSWKAAVSFFSMQYREPTKAEQVFIHHIGDLCRKAAESPCFTSFLNERAQIDAERIASRYPGICAVFHGGFEGAVRKVLCLYPDWMDRAAINWPISALAAQHGKGEVLPHKNVLGSLVGLGIERDSIGDIILDDGQSRFVVLQSVAPVILDELQRIGRVGVRCVPSEMSELKLTQRFESLRSTVSSTRLDCLVSMLTGVSRENSAAMIKSGLVQCNYRVEENISAKFLPGDTITVRSYGKYVVDSVGAPTRKGRLPVECRKYA